MPQPAKKTAKARARVRPRGETRLLRPRRVPRAGGPPRKGPAHAGARPPGRTTPIAVRFDQFTLKRLRALAALRNTGYQTLLKEFIVERLYEEEKREGIIKS